MEKRKKNKNILFVTGFSSSGKTTISNKIKDVERDVEVIHLDNISFCIPKSVEEKRVSTYIKIL